MSVCTVFRFFIGGIGITGSSSFLTNEPRIQFSDAPLVQSWLSQNESSPVFCFAAMLSLLLVAVNDRKLDRTRHHILISLDWFAYMHAIGGFLQILFCFKDRFLHASLVQSSRILKMFDSNAETNIFVARSMRVLILQLSHSGVDE